MDEEHFLVDESPPVVHPFKLESCLDGGHVHFAHLVLQVGAVQGEPFQEEEARVVAQHGIVGILAFQVFGVPMVVGVGKTHRRREQRVGIERRIEVCVQLEEAL